MNSMKLIKIEKITLNIGTGTDATKLEKGIKLINHISGKKPVKTFTTKRIPTWGVRPGLPLGCKLTLRKKGAKEMLVRLLQAKENQLASKQFDNVGNLAFGIHEYIDIPGAKYDPDVGIIGLEVCVTLERAGFRVKKRRVKKNPISKKHLITRDEAIDYMQKEFNVEIK
ncbi:50S ribosomal protein L5 [Candidatus Woesearchaeota archaeon]|nr:50S ribosomal protein L5 [Candidatus Woesearchaeota archaeon]|tara:strand:+ start:16075 stop:16581 length:507 start_codon:yes stop_codon:yes gene_type:complete